MSGCNLSHNMKGRMGGQQLPQDTNSGNTAHPHWGGAIKWSPKWAQTLWFSLGLARK